MIFLFVSILQASSFEYLSAIVHSQDVSPVPSRELWHPHLYLAKDPEEDFYEIRHSSQYYDVSISFLQTSASDSAPGVMNCECRFVKDEVEEEEEETTFLQVMTPSKVKPKGGEEVRDKEISIGAYVPKGGKGEEYRSGVEYVQEEGEREGRVSKGGPEVIVVQGYPERYQQQPVYTQQQPVYTQQQQPVYTQQQQPVYTQQQPVYGPVNTYIPPNTQGYVQTPQVNYNTQPIYVQQAYTPGYNTLQSQEFFKPQQPVYVQQPTYTQPLLVPTFSNPQYKPQEYQQPFVQTYRQV